MAMKHLRDLSLALLLGAALPSSALAAHMMGGGHVGAFGSHNSAPSAAPSAPSSPPGNTPEQMGFSHDHDGDGHHHHHHFDDDFFFFFDDPFFYPYPYPYVASYVPTSPPTSDYYWYYCADSKSYYPYVKECASDWQRVPVTPPPPPAPK